MSLAILFTASFRVPAPPRGQWLTKSAIMWLLKTVSYCAAAGELLLIIEQPWWEEVFLPVLPPRCFSMNYHNCCGTFFFVFFLPSRIVRERWVGNGKLLLEPSSDVDWWTRERSRRVFPLCNFVLWTLKREVSQMCLYSNRAHKFLLTLPRLHQSNPSIMITPRACHPAALIL